MSDAPIPTLTGQHLDLPDPILYGKWLKWHLGDPAMDHRIAPLVSAFNARGFQTWGSCQGHPETFPMGTWYPWIYFGDTSDVPEHRASYRKNRPWRDKHYELGAALHDVIETYYSVIDMPVDEVMPTFMRLGYYGFWALVPTGCSPGGVAHRLVGRHLGIEGRVDIYERAWQEFDRFTTWMLTGEVMPVAAVTRFES